MKHIGYMMKGADPAPAGDGDTKSWFEYYKWNTDEETYVPVGHPFKDAEEGDYLWFVMDGRVLGGARITRVDTPPLPTQRQELWFDASKILEIPVERYLAGWFLGGVLDACGDDLLALSVPRVKG